MTESERDLLHDVRRLMVLFLLIVLVLGAATIAGLEWVQHGRANDQRAFDRRLDERLVLGCRAVNENRRAGNKNARVLVGFLRTAEQTRRVLAKQEAGAKRARDLKAAATFKRLAESYSILPLLDCRSAFDVSQPRTGGK